MNADISETTVVGVEPEEGEKKTPEQQAKKTTTTPAWSLPVASKPSSFAEIMQEQHQKNNAANDSLAVLQAEQEKLFASLGGSEQEMLEWAMKESLEASDAITKGLSECQLQESEREMIEAALREADEASQTPNAVPSTLDAEREMIEAALREADAKERLEEEAESLRLVMQLQQEELTMARQKCPEQNSNVRTMTRAQFAAEKYGETSRLPPVEEMYQNPEGFRMNQQQQQELSSGWYRKDKNTIVGPNNEIRTKHDVQLQGQTNASFLDLDVVDEETGLRTHVGNTAFNAFRKTVAGSYHSKGGHRGTSKGVAAHGTGRAGSDADATKGAALDQHVRLHISKAINAGIIEKCNGVVKQGKEAVVYHAVGGLNSNPDNPDNVYDVAIKVFKRIQEFKGRGEYVDGDPRYAGRPFRSFTDREQLEVWTEKEYRNLVRAYRAKVPVPNPIHYKDNLIFMRFLGKDGWPAPQIREIRLRKGSSKWNALYDQVMEAVQRLFRDARLVHGDLSEYNILVAPETLVDHSESEESLRAALIDFGQAVEVRHPKAEELLQRDLTRVNEFFTKQGVTNAMSETDAFRFVVGDHSFSPNTNDVKMCYPI